jgi:integrase
MPRKPQNAPLVCAYFTWRLIRRDGVYYADGRGGKHHLGKHSLATRDHDEALERLRQLDRQKAAELGLTELQPVAQFGPLSIADGWRLYMDYCGRANVLGGVDPSTLGRYESVRVKHIEFCSKHGVTSWSDFDKSQLERYANVLGRTNADRTIYLEVNLLKSLTRWLVAEGRLPPGSELKYPLRKPQGTDTYCYTPAEVSALVAHCRSIPTLAWLAQVIIVLAHTGMRISELAGLRWSDVNLAQKTVTVADERSSRRKRQAGTARKTKGRRSGVIPMHPVLAGLLQTLPRQADGHVLHAQRGGKLLPRVVLQAFIDHAIEPLRERFPTVEGDTGFEHGRLHSFRHFFCSQAFLGGASEGEIREWLGHADSKMVEHYRHLRSDDAQRKMDRIEFMTPPDSRPGDVA